MLLDSELEISTQRSTGGALWTACAPLRAAEVALAAADREGAVERDGDELFVAFGELEGVAFGVRLADGLAVALLCGAAVVAALLGDLAGVAFGVAFAAGWSDVGCGFVVLVDFAVPVGVGDGDELGVEDEVGDADAVADGEELGVADAAGVAEELGVEEAAGDGEELGVAGAAGFAGAVEVLAVLGFAVAGVLEVLGDGDAVGFSD